ncbi:hypothetical protein Acsp02_89700 [Actinoplanes sp. NBRC 103695]|nr:hypothetical protein Acsp02_89700 [Actinoplanes sp. NBRC 103695]
MPICGHCPRSRGQSLGTAVPARQLATLADNFLVSPREVGSLQALGPLADDDRDWARRVGSRAKLLFTNTKIIC